MKKSPKKRRSEMTEEEKEEADLQATLRKAKSTAKKEWSGRLLFLNLGKALKISSGLRELWECTKVMLNVPMV